VDYIISGDIHLLELKEYDTIKIVTAKDYLERI
jgi:predicted nucleic acid-binding protein